ncbi:MAG: cbb3-type cytochrome c oxidase subunit I [Deltaproteobacteria bacterium]|nr:cbb3-type cytochrome c oxidase subunit I [Deltaproteobacteria bacterium]
MDDALYERRVAGVSLSIGAITIVLFGVTIFIGVIARTSQGGFITLRPDVFYEFMTLHSVGVAGSLMTGITAMMWYSLRKHLNLHMNLMQIMFGIIGAVVVSLLAATLLGFYGTGWTFLYPLPFKSAGAWDDWAAGLYLLLLLCVVAAMSLSWGDVVVTAARKYTFSWAVGWKLIAGKDTPETTPPPVVLISVITSLCGLFSNIAGATVLILLLIHWADPGFYLDYLYIKNLIYYFGHILMNMAMYMSVAVVYELLPLYAKRPWKSNKIVAISWNAAFIAVSIAYMHHLLQDFPQPFAIQVLGVFGSYMAAFPATVVTVIGAMVLVYRSGIKWTVAPLYMFLGLMSWAIGGFWAVLDAGFNNAFHNTMFVPGHFHLYLLAGTSFIFVATLYNMTEELGGCKDTFEDRLGLWAWFIGAYGVALTFLLSGIFGTPRRYAVQMPGKEVWSAFGAIFGWIVIFALILVIGRYLTRLQKVKPLRS